MNLPKQAKPVKRKATAISNTKGVAPSDSCGCPNACIGGCAWGSCIGYCI
jgi:hypothetical protein